MDRNYDTIKVMKKEELLLERLIVYNQSQMYPFHMPGHKRKADFPNPYSVDITEIEGFDNLHHAEGILKESMEWAASVYQSDKTYYLVNGSSCGILSSISGTTHHGGKILVSRNAHKSVYHGIILNYLNVHYVYPQIIPEMGIQGGILPSDVENILSRHDDIEAVLIVSPTYDGIVSDIRSIAEIVHKRNIPLIVDEAHGAHFPFHSSFPESALACGADIVVQSLHKTLSSFTQTAVMHVKRGYVNIGRLERYLGIFQTSSPSYVFMAGIESCIYDMSQNGEEYLCKLQERLADIREQLSTMKYLKIADRHINKSFGVFDQDESKIIISSLGCTVEGSILNGEMLGNWLRDEYYLEMEMCGAYTVTAIISWQDSREDLQRLADALLDIDSRLGWVQITESQDNDWTSAKPVSELTMAEAFEHDSKWCLIGDCEGEVSAEFIYLYPPGIPIITPGEVITKHVLELVNCYLKMGLPVQGMEDRLHQHLKVIKNGRQGA
ncbi:MAG: aminotransferase class I/II-fold pyridoxal phosphate-dependent enzyme [Lachnospiraceae bacterium]